LAVASLITLGQRVHKVRTSPGAMEPLQPSGADNTSGEQPEAP
jgi:CDP-diacylglycerol--glycerol-3-phosphate 3-phosphatidyltransferase